MTDPTYVDALGDFQQARRQALLEQLMARLTGRPDHLLSYDEVRQMVGSRSSVDRGLHEIPVKAIVGSVGRYTDFTRTFLPRSDTLEERWARVKKVGTETGWAPIEVYKLGDAYFVLDGNHRVSVARQMGMDTIPAYVTEVRTKVPLTADVDPEQLIIKARHADFLEQTRLDETRPDADLTVTEAGAYDALEEHIAVHRYYMGLEQHREIPYEEAAAHWYDTVYWPVVALIREKGLLQEFPNRTETDLYLWLAEHRAELEEALGWELQPGEAAVDLAVQHGQPAHTVLARVGEKILNVITPDEFEPGPPPGAWRTHRVSGRHDDRLFVDILAAINGRESGWTTLEQLIVVAQREGSTIRGLHIVADPEDKESLSVQEIRDRFQWRLGEMGISGRLAVEVGDVSRAVCDRARWNDLVGLPLSYPPGRRVLGRLGSGFRKVVQRCPRPILAVSSHLSPLDRPLLAYDGSPKAEEALFIATYLSGRWQLPLTVVVVEDGDGARAQAMPKARDYLAHHGIEAAFVERQGDPVAEILDVGQEHGCNFLIMGGYGERPVVEMVLGSTLNEMLREYQSPILIAR